MKIASRRQTTIIITTHYVEEARQANVVGMLRGGRLLAQSDPDVLMENYKKKTLEDVFLELCISDTLKDQNATTGSEMENGQLENLEVTYKQFFINYNVFCSYFAAFFCFNPFQEIFLNYYV